MLGTVYGVGTAITWGAGSVLIKAQVGKLPPTQMLAIKSIAGVPASILALVLLPGGGAPCNLTVVAWLALIGCVLAGYFGADILFVRALEYVPLTRAFPVQATYPLFAIALAWIVLGEKVTWTLLVGSVVVVVGISLISGKAPDAGTPESAVGNSVTKGLLLSGLSAIFWGGSAVLLRIGLGDRSAVLVNAAVAVITALAFAPLSRPVQTLAYVRGHARFGIAVGLSGALGGTGLANLLYVLAVDTAGVGRAATLASTAPLFAAVLAVTALGERMSFALALGTLLCFAGIALIVGG